MRIKRGHPIISREFNLFKQLSGSTLSIDVHDLITEYQIMMRAHNIKIVDVKKSFQLLLSAELHDGDLLVDPSNHTISYPAFSASFGWVLSTQRSYNYPASSINLSKNVILDWHRHGPLVLMTVLDVFVIAAVVIGDTSLPEWLMLSRSCAVIILVSLFLLLLPLVGISSIVPDYILMNVFPSEHSALIHKTLGIKILVASVLHTVGHFIHIHVSINNCKNGCARSSVRVVPKTDSQIAISYSYFASQYAYLTGFVLACTFGLLGFVVLMNHWKMIRFGTNQLLHKALALTSIVLTIAHGCSQLLGFNFSFVLTLPLVLLYAWNHRREVRQYKIDIARWLVTPTLIKLYLRDDRCEDILNKFNTATIYINHGSVSRWEWHPFTLSKNSNSSDAVLTIKRVGVWTNKFANLLCSRIDFSEHVNVGSVVRSKFRFHSQYKVRYFLCAGIGITAFISAMRDTIACRNNSASVLIWSISDVNIVKEFSEELRLITSMLCKTEVHIYFSNSRAQTLAVSDDTKANFTYLQSIIFKSSGYDIATNCLSVCCCSFHRADITSILSQALLKYKNGIQQIGVFVCGPKRYVDHAHVVVDVLNRNEYNIKLRIWSEGV